jgi:hypothetical protein
VYRLGSSLRLSVVGFALALLPLSAGYAEERRGEELLTPLKIAREAELRDARAGAAAIPDVAPLTTSVILWDEARPPMPPVRNTAERPNVTGHMGMYQR